MAARFLLAREFHKWPWEVDEAPTDLVLETLKLMSLIPRDPPVVIER
jgi:hypothetical protein